MRYIHREWMAGNQPVTTANMSYILNILDMFIISQQVQKFPYDSSFGKENLNKQSKKKDNRCWIIFL